MARTIEITATVLRGIDHPRHALVECSACGPLAVVTVNHGTDDPDLRIYAAQHRYHTHKAGAPA